MGEMVFAMDIAIKGNIQEVVFSGIAPSCGKGFVIGDSEISMFDKPSFCKIPDEGHVLYEETFSKFL